MTQHAQGAFCDSTGLARADQRAHFKEGDVMFLTMLVANRGEIAVRAFRAAYELGVATVAVYPYEDRNSLHRLKADEAYEIGQRGHPVRAHLTVDEIVSPAVASKADAVYPGYGLLFENPELASACASEGITFVGPSTESLEVTGNKSRAIAAAQEIGLPVLSSSAPSRNVAELLAAADRQGDRHREQLPATP
jgi:pyruvate carboxylase